MKKLNFGCGIKNIQPGWDNVDILKDHRIDKSFNFDVFPYPLDENKYDYVFLNQVMEHLIHPDRVLNELYKCCKDNAIIEIEVPFVNSKSAYCNLQHKSFFNERSFVLFAQEDKMFELVSQDVGVQRFLRWLPRSITNVLAVFVMNIHVSLNVKLRIIKPGISKQ